MEKISPGKASQISITRRAVPVVVGASLILFGLMEFLSMGPGVLAGTLRNGDMMTVGLGLQFFAGIALVVYGVLMSGGRSN
ncbi:MAG: hypothetical protein OK456_10540 [Thaumarchaeota archaeon]|nr:hypothetical protein [Nitrososphaerota archaeon]